MNSSVNYKNDESVEIFADDDICDACGHKYKNHSFYRHPFAKPGSMTCKICGIKSQNHTYFLHDFEKSS